MRKLVVLLLMMTTALASCETYVYSATTDFANPGTYPDCFGVAGRYKEAALCYSAEANVNYADMYYKKAAEYYLKGIAYVGVSGDYPLRAPSYEYAGDMEAQLGDKALAASYYDQAASEYLKVEDLAGVNAVNAKKDALTAVPIKEEPQTGFAITGENLALGLIVVIVAIVLFFYVKRPSRVEEAPVEVESTPIFRVDEPRAEPKPDAKQNAKDKMRDKIRKKYGLE